MTYRSEFKDVLKETGKTTFWLLKIMIPISIIIKILVEYGIIEIIGKNLSSVMGVVGLPGEFGLVWATAMLTNIYGGLVVFFNLSLFNTYTVAEVTVLGSMILVAHTLPIEARIAQKAGVRLWYTLSLRISAAIILGFILNLLFTKFNLYQTENVIFWKPGVINPTMTQWILGELRNYLMIFLIILGLMLLMRILKNTGILNKMNDFLKPGLEFLGMSKNAAPIAIIGMTIGLAYGGGLIVKEAQSKIISKKDIFYSLSMMGLSHSLIEDTLLIFAIGGSLVGILLGRVVFTLIILILLIRAINLFSKKTFEKIFMNK